MGADPDRHRIDYDWRHAVHRDPVRIRKRHLCGKRRITAIAAKAATSLNPLPMNSSFPFPASQWHKCRPRALQVPGRPWSRRTSPSTATTRW